MKIIKIETCDDCPYEDWYQCQRLDIEDAQCAVNGVRDDCPLEDAPETPIPQRSWGWAEVAEDKG